MLLTMLNITMAMLLMVDGAQASKGPDHTGKPDPPFAAEFAKLKSAAEKLTRDVEKGYTDAKTEEENKEKATVAFNRDGTPLADKALALIAPHVQDPAAAEVLTWRTAPEPIGQRLTPLLGYSP
jgi:hypothetical protein